MRLLPHLIGLTAAMLAAGCRPAASEAVDPTPAARPAVTFQGEIEPQFVGSWTAPKGVSGLDLRKDGSARITSTVPTPRGIVRSSLDGEWRVAGGDLYMRYTDPNKEEKSVKYPATLSGRELTLDQGSRSKMTYTRK